MGDHYVRVKMMLEWKHAVKYFIPTRTCRLRELQVRYTPFAPKCNAQDALGITICEWPGRAGGGEGG